jgi:hypothetical protein
MTGLAEFSLRIVFKSILPSTTSPWNGLGPNFDEPGSLGRGVASHANLNNEPRHKEAEWSRPEWKIPTSTSM